MCNHNMDLKKKKGSLNASTLNPSSSKPMLKTQVLSGSLSTSSIVVILLLFFLFVIVIVIRSFFYDTNASFLVIWLLSW
jgi:hypothetical protein